MSKTPNLKKLLKKAKRYYFDETLIEKCNIEIKTLKRKIKDLENDNIPLTFNYDQFQLKDSVLGINNKLLYRCYDCLIDYKVIDITYEKFFLSFQNITSEKINFRTSATSFNNKDLGYFFHKVKKEFNYKSLGTTDQSREFYVWFDKTVIIETDRKKESDLFNFRKKYINTTIVNEISNEKRIEIDGLFTNN